MQPFVSSFIMASVTQCPSFKQYWTSFGQSLAETIALQCPTSAPLPGYKLTCTDGDEAAKDDILYRTAHCQKIKCPKIMHS